MQDAKAVADKFGLSIPHVKDIFRVHREREGRKPRTYLADDQRIWAVRQLQAGASAKKVAKTLGVSRSIICYSLRLEQHRESLCTPSMSPPISTAEDGTEDMEEDPELEVLGAEIEEFCFQKELRRVEDWITDTQDHLDSHNQHTPGDLAWKSLRECVGIFSDAVETMRRAETRRARKLQKIFSTLAGDMEDIDASLSRFGPAVEDQPRVVLILRFLRSTSPELEVALHSGHARMDTPFLEGSSSSNGKDLLLWS